jgi:hypothetical protein
MKMVNNGNRFVFVVNEHDVHRGAVVARNTTYASIDFFCPASSWK